MTDPSGVGQHPRERDHPSTVVGCALTGPARSYSYCGQWATPSPPVVGLRILLLPRAAIGSSSPGFVKTRVRGFPYVILPAYTGLWGPFRVGWSP